MEETVTIIKIRSAESQAQMGQMEPNQTQQPETQHQQSHKMVQPGKEASKPSVI